MSDFKKTQILNIRETRNLSLDNVYWRRLGFPVTTKQYGFINGLEFSPVEPHLFSVAYSTVIDIYNPVTNKPCASLTKFKKCAYGGSFRQDGQLLVAGGQDGRVKLFSVDSKLMLRLFKGHESAVHAAKFLNNNQNVISFSDDKTIRSWDTGTEKQLIMLEGHTDYIRCGATSSRSPDLFISGSYDHTVKFWDLRQADNQTLSMDHGCPVEAVLLFPNDSLVISAGGTNLKIWDLAAGGRMLHQISNHRKTISSISFCSKNRRLLSGSLDRQVKVYDLSDYKVVHSMNYPAPIVKLGISSDDQYLAVAMTDNLLSVQCRRAENQAKDSKIKTKFRSPRFKKDDEEKEKFDIPADTIIHTDQFHSHLAAHDQFLRSFEHKKSVDRVLFNNFKRGHKPEIVVSLLKELIRRQALEKALSDRVEKNLVPILKFVAKHLGKGRFTSVMIDTANVLLDIYGTKLNGIDQQTFDLFKQLRFAIDQHACDLRSMSSMMGALQVIMNMPSISTVSQNDDCLESSTVTADILNVLLTGDESVASKCAESVEIVSSRKRKIES